MEKSRTAYSLKNAKTGAIVQIINKIMAFVVRYFFIKTLNSEYLGVNGLFTNILNILSFAELGIGTAIIYNMYKPVANNDKEKIKSLMLLYKKAYNIIGLVVFVLGLLVIPFMKYIIKDVPNINENLIFIYLLFLINTSSSYFFTYKKSIIYANQQQSIINNIDSLFYLSKSFLEIIFLLITKNFIVYLSIQILGTFIENIVIAKKANKMYPYLKEKEVKKLNKNETKDIFDNVKALVVYKFGGVIMNGTDNILISSIINVETVGLCSNYIMVISAIKNIILSAINGVTASIGNLNVVSDNEKKESIFYQISFINYLIFSFCSIAFILLLEPLVKIWLGDKFLLGSAVVIALSINFYVEGMRISSYTYRTTLGLFKKAKLTPYIGAIVNIVLSIILGKSIGVVGIFVATIIAQLVSYSWIDPYLIHKYSFGTSSKKYFKKYIIYTIIYFLEMLITIYIAGSIKCNGFSELIIKAIIVLIIPNLLNLIIFCKTNEFKCVYKKIKSMFIKK